MQSQNWRFYLSNSQKTFWNKRCRCRCFPIDAWILTNKFTHRPNYSIDSKGISFLGDFLDWLERCLHVIFLQLLFVLLIFFVIPFVLLLGFLHHFPVVTVRYRAFAKVWDLANSILASEVIRAGWDATSHLRYLLCVFSSGIFEAAIGFVPGSYVQKGSWPFCSTLMMKFMYRCSFIRLARPVMVRTHGQSFSMSVSSSFGSVVVFLLCNSYHFYSWNVSEDGY